MTTVRYPTGDATREEATAQLLAPSRRWAFRYDVVAPNGTVKGHAEMGSAPKVANNDLAEESKRTGEFLIMPGAEIDYFQDRLRPYALLQLPGDRWWQWPLGTFHLTAATSREGSIADPVPATGFDSLLVLAEDRVTSRYHVAAGTNYRAAVNTLLTSAGFSTKAISSTSLTVPGGGEEWDPGTSKLDIINDLLAAIGFRSLVMSPLGVPTSQPYLSPKDAPVVWDYFVGPESVVHPEAATTLDLHSIPNSWVAWVSEPDRPLIISRLTNNDPNSATSTVARGRTIVAVLNQPNRLPRRRGKLKKWRKFRAATQSVLDDYVARAAEEASQTYETLEFSTGLMPFHGSGDVVRADWGQGVKRYRHTEWEMELAPGGVMQHKARRVVAL